MVSLTLFLDWLLVTYWLYISSTNLWWVIYVLFTDRNVRIEKMKADLKELEKQNEKLRRQDNALRKQYDKVLDSFSLYCFI